VSGRYVLDGSVQRFGTVVIGGSPLKLFRLTAAGAALVARIAAGDRVADSTLVDRLLDAGAIHPSPAVGDSPFTAADVTLVVPTLGAPAHVPAGNVVLVDDGSQPPVAGAHVRLPTNAGPAAARNAGLELVHTPLVAFVDTDVTLPEGWLDALLPHFADPRVALVAPRVLTVGAGRQPFVRYEERHSPLDLGAEPARIRAGSRVSYVPAAALVCRVDALRAIGGFDTSLRVGEDVDVVWRLDTAGWRCRYEPAAAVHHATRPTWRAWWCQRVAYGSSAAPLAIRHLGALAPLRMSGWSIATWLLGVLGHPVAGTALGVGSAAALVPKLPDVPARAAFRLAAVGNARAGEQIATAVRRAWWPLVALTALRSRSARKVLLASAVAAGHPLRVVDDVAYSVGLWRGVARHRTLGPLTPDITSWPGRRAGA
jgi:mycofactocin system glycosyltransferase